MVDDKDVKFLYERYNINSCILSFLFITVIFFCAVLATSMLSQMWPFYIGVVVFIGASVWIVFKFFSFRKKIAEKFGNDPTPMFARRKKQMSTKVDEEIVISVAESIQQGYSTQEIFEALMQKHDKVTCLKIINMAKEVAKQ